MDPCPAIRRRPGVSRLFESLPESGAHPHDWMRNSCFFGAVAGFGLKGKEVFTKSASNAHGASLRIPKQVAKPPTSLETEMNASVARPGSAIVPMLRYRDVERAIDWLCNAFAFEKHHVVSGEGGTIHYAEITFGNGMVMLGRSRSRGPTTS